MGGGGVSGKTDRGDDAWPACSLANAHFLLLSLHLQLHAIYEELFEKSAARNDVQSAGDEMILALRLCGGDKTNYLYCDIRLRHFDK